MRARIEDVEHIIDVRVEFEAGVPAASRESSPRSAHVHDQLRVVGQEFVGADACQRPILLDDIVVDLGPPAAQTGAELPEVGYGGKRWARDVAETIPRVDGAGDQVENQQAQSSKCQRRQGGQGGRKLELLVSVHLD